MRLTTHKLTRFAFIAVVSLMGMAATVSEVAAAVPGRVN